MTAVLWREHIKVLLKLSKNKTNKKSIDYYEAVKIAYIQCEHMRKHFDSPKTINNFNIDNKGLWEFTYKTIHEEPRIKVVNQDPDNLLVAWSRTSVI
ncbi:hypothetical protein BH18THE2_BH18THE2_28460 [soil metagenome]